MTSISGLRKVWVSYHLTVSIQLTAFGPLINLIYALRYPIHCNHAKVNNHQVNHSNLKKKKKNDTPVQFSPPPH